MRCAEVQRAVAGGWGRGSPLAWRVRRHLARCGACAREAGRIERILHEVGRLPVPDPGPGYWEEFLPRLRRRIDSERRIARVAASGGAGPARSVARRWLAVGAAAALIVIAAGVAIRLAGRIDSVAAGAEMTALAQRVEDGIRSADGEIRGEAADFVAPGDTFSPVEPGEEKPLDVDAALEALMEVTGLLSPSTTGDPMDIDGMIEGLDETQLRKLVDDLGARDARSPAPASKGQA